MGKHLAFYGTVKTICLKRPQATYTWGWRLFSTQPFSSIGPRLGAWKLGGGGSVSILEGVPSPTPWAQLGLWGQCLWCWCPRRFPSSSTHTPLQGLCQGWQPLNASLIFKSIQVISIWILCILSDRTKCKYIQIHPYEEINRGSSA